MIIDGVRNEQRRQSQDLGEGQPDVRRGDVLILEAGLLPQQFLNVRGAELDERHTSLASQAAEMGAELERRLAEFGPLALEAVAQIGDAADDLAPGRHRNALVADVLGKRFQRALEVLAQAIGD